MSTRENPSLDAPGPGTWRLDSQHFPLPLTRFAEEIFPAAVTSGWARTEPHYPLLGTTTFASVGGFVYLRRTPPDTKAAPSTLMATALDKVRARHWEDEARTWHQSVKPDSIRSNMELASVGVQDLDQQGLLDHLSACRDNWYQKIALHHVFNFAALVPSAYLVADVSDWTELSPSDALSLLDGASLISAGVTPELLALVDAINADENTKTLVKSDITARELIRELRESPGMVGDAMERFWLVDGHRMATGFDVSDRAAHELPDMLVQSIRNVVESGVPDQSVEAEVLSRFVRNQVPAEHQSRFDEEIESARATSGIRDERALYNDAWAGGIMRKALLEAGSRLVREGRLQDEEHLVEADWAEINALFNGTGGPSARELSDRRDRRLSIAWQDAPPFLGPAPTPPAPIKGLPSEVARLMRSLGVMMSTINAPPAHQDSEDLVGVVASKGHHEGIARVATTGYAFDQIKAGDILVTSQHSSAFNAIVQRLGAIVSDTGGPLSHLSIVAREFGIPCIVSCKNAVSLINDGDRIQVDAESGRVTVLD